MVAGGFKNDLEALGDRTPHDRRYERLVEYTSIIRQLLSGQKPVTLAGEYHQIDKLRLSPPLPPELFPGLFVSGSSEAGRAAARSLEAVAIEYPKPAQDAPELSNGGGGARGIRVGMITLRREDEAWEKARARFPEDRKGQLAHQLAMKVSDSVWHGQLSGTEQSGEGSPYWLVPFQNYKTMCPYLVGSHERVGAELARYLSSGCRTFILDVPREPDDLEQTEAAFERALDRCPNP
jgi:alkanesulfonate monooxygenase